MKSLIAVLLSSVLCLVLETEAQFFGGVNRGIGFQQETFGYKAGPAWGSVSQNRDFTGATGPKTFGAGVNLLTPHNSGLSASVYQQPGIGGQGSVRGSLNLLNTPKHDLSAFAQHDRFLNKDFKPIGPATNSGGLQYQHANGFAATGSLAQTQGQPLVKTLSVGVPLFKSDSGNTRVNLEGSTSHGGGKVDNKVGISLEAKF